MNQIWRIPSLNARVMSMDCRGELSSSFGLPIWTPILHAIGANLSPPSTRGLISSSRTLFGSILRTKRKIVSLPGDCNIRWGREFFFKDWKMIANSFRMERQVLIFRSLFWINALYIYVPFNWYYLIHFFHLFLKIN